MPWLDLDSDIADEFALYTAGFDRRELSNVDARAIYSSGRGAAPRLCKCGCGLTVPQLALGRTRIFATPVCRWRRPAPVEPQEPAKVCACGCGSVIAGGTRGRPRVYASDRCHEHARFVRRAAARKDRRAVAAWGHCAWTTCHCLLPAPKKKGPLPKYCTPRCQWHAYADRKRAKARS